ncbi:unnamed protein product [Leptidea sinapis]|uniref:Uncharacterized protein n=1 Tax=Leptidea sinapis TaxID=189913 RepID=A0A5E4R4X0_9NEOP|nr:unnamed protein product [Leptidea sinapis]
MTQAKNRIKILRAIKRKERTMTVRRSIWMQMASHKRLQRVKFIANDLTKACRKSVKSQTFYWAIITTALAGSLPELRQLSVRGSVYNGDAGKDVCAGHPGVLRVAFQQVRLLRDGMFHLGACPHHIRHHPTAGHIRVALRALVEGIQSIGVHSQTW